MSSVFHNIFRQYKQGLAVACCSMSSGLTLGYMCEDLNKFNTKKIITQYENEINTLKQENSMLKIKSYERATIQF